MNKQEAIERIEKLDEHYGISQGVYLKKRDVVSIISQIDEPQKVTVPKFMAEWIEECKASSRSLRDSMKGVHKMYTYPNQETFARAWLDGYEIEQEKLYTVEIPNPNSAGGKNVLFKQQSTGRLILDMLNPNINKPKYLNLTESEIKQDFEWAFQFAKPVNC